MSFYLAFSNDIKKRRINKVFYFKDQSLYLYNFGINDLLMAIPNDMDPISFAIQYIDIYKLDNIEILLPSTEKEFVYKACRIVSEYLYKNDNTIGLLVDNDNYQEDYKTALSEYGITTSSGVRNKKPTRLKYTVSTGVEKKKKPSTNELREISCPSSPKKKESATRGIPRFEVSFSVSRESSGLEVDESFHEKFLKLLNESGKSNVEVYNKGGISRQVFSNIISSKNMIPKKDTVICLIIGMELPYIDAMKLLESAGYALSKSIVFDVVVTKYLKKEIFDLDIINNELAERQCPLLGWKPRGF